MEHLWVVAVVLSKLACPCLSDMLWRAHFQAWEYSSASLVHLNWSAIAKTVLYLAVHSLLCWFPMSCSDDGWLLSCIAVAVYVVSVGWTEMRNLPDPFYPCSWIKSLKVGCFLSCLGVFQLPLVQAQYQFFLKLQSTLTYNSSQSLLYTQVKTGILHKAHCPRPSILSFYWNVVRSYFLLAKCSVIFLLIKRSVIKYPIS